MAERRFNEAEAAAIFECAAEAQQSRQHQLPSGEGMTLTELQAIGREVGISPEQVAHAARALELGGQPASRHFMGLPVGVGLTVDLNRNLTEEEWERVVGDLRQTFDARGTLTREGSLRGWSNGNLQAFVEPGAKGHRLRLRTFKSDAPGMIGGGIAVLGVAVTAIIAATLGGAIDEVGFLLGAVATAGAAMIGSAAFRLPGWAELRRRQMEEVAGRAAITSTSSAPDQRS
ncbi:MAG TPA: hypothetical protein VNO75_06050 [Gemmatimonadaceae bacterium]|nr:hypothetical protein [Gemmatimonadaceae bacterium]